ncbi:MAG: hypothetical protein MI717_01755 [Spirochaetales bacterium]|nr:hypothetical protein [Spirochaetales bacterium]
MLEKFLETFYQTISFGHHETFKRNAFQALFMENALLIEKRGNIIITKSVQEHIKEFEEARIKRPDLFSMGFHEKQICYKTLSTDSFFLVESHYKKQYTKNGHVYHEDGINLFTLIATDHSYKICSVAW